MCNVYDTAAASSSQAEAGSCVGLGSCGGRYHTVPGSSRLSPSAVTAVGGPWQRNLNADARPASLLRTEVRLGCAVIGAGGVRVVLARDPESRARTPSYGEHLAQIGSGTCREFVRLKQGPSSQWQRKSSVCAEGGVCSPGRLCISTRAAVGSAAGTRHAGVSALKPSGAGSLPCPDESAHLHIHCHTSPGFPQHCMRDDTSDLLRTYRLQKDRDFEDPYNGPGSSLHKLHAVCHPDYSVPEGLSEANCAPGSPCLFCSHSECCPAMPPDVKYVSSKHRLIKVETSAGSDDASEKLNKASMQLVTSAPSGKDKVLMADDYSDPFDAKSELNSLGKGQNTGYMEPYEAQRIMTEFQKQEGMKYHQKNMQLYDTPYEPEGSGLESDSESVVSHHLQESKLPQDDNRPADEYDQPWEWNRVNIPSLAGVSLAESLERRVVCGDDCGDEKGGKEMWLWKGPEKPESNDPD
ncbi:PREDICTED: SH2 domain-containing adapter protein B-like [Apaloderma vittatum]|uniref:SH2 domain-containing adapter protein B-like n=1 Tax=Apaloderma vittatum TaxID=57397 RepID=UPI000521BFE5|nr:PREDICTED: SH2 domain-containing adapter protein B-like [Apaloderma vittatum]